MTDVVQAAIVARIAEALNEDIAPSIRAHMEPIVTRRAEAVADALGMAAILSIVEERRNAHYCKIRTSHAYPPSHREVCACGKAYPCDERNALDAIHNKLAGGAGE